MPNTTIQLKKSSTPSAIPADLANGELAINFADGKLFYKNTAGYIAEISGAGTGLNYFGTVNANNTLVVADTAGDILTMATGNNITIVGDAVNDRVTIGVRDNPTFTGDVTGNKLISSQSAGDEGGEIILATAQTNNNLSTSVTVDIYQNRLRFFETGGTNRGAYIDLSIAGTGVASNLLSAGGGTAVDTVARNIASSAFDKANAANVLAFDTGVGANAFASATIAGANSAVGSGANAFASATIAGANSAVGVGANNFTAATIAGANSAVGTGANNFTSATIAGANSAVGTGANNFAAATIAGANSAVGAGANAYSNATFVKLNAGTQQITGNISISGSLTVSGNTYKIDANTLYVQDPLIYLAGNNYTSDIVDIGFVGNYVNATGQNVHTGLFRDATVKEYYLFQGYDQEPNYNDIDPNGNNFTLAVLNSTIRTSNLILGGVNAITLISNSSNGANAFAAATIAGANSAVGTAANSFASSTIAGSNTIAIAAFNKANSTTYTSNVVISVADNTNAALRITQTGTGDAIRVEDSSNPDVTPFVVSNTGLVGIGTQYPSDLFEVQGQTLGFVFGKGITLKAESVTGSAAYPGGSLKFIAGYGAPGGGSGPGGTGGHLFTHNGTGITSPSYFFHVDGGTGTGGYGNAPGPDIFMKAVSVNIAQSAATAGSVYLAAGRGTPNGSIYLRTLDVDRLQVDPSGNVLIGRSTSTVGQSAILDVNGAVNASAYLINGQSIISTIAGANTAVGAGANAWANGVWSRSNTYMTATVAGANTAVGAGANAWANGVWSRSNTYMTATVDGANTISIAAFNQTNTVNIIAIAAFDKANSGPTLDAANNTQIIYNNQGSANGSNNFVYDYANNTVIIGSSDSQNIIYGEPAEKLQIHWTRPGVDEYPGGIVGISAWANSAYGTELHFTKSRGSSVGDHVAVKNGDDFFWIVGGGSDGSTFAGDSVGINATVDGIPSGTSIPGRLTFWTTSPGNTYGAERMRIDANGKVGIGTSSPQYTLEVLGSFAAQTKSFVINHPTQLGKKLRYGSLEGPENGVYIRGRTQDDMIELPDYWTKLIDEKTITVSLTPIGKTKMPTVKCIQDNVVYLSKPRFSQIDCYFHIFAERKDVERLIVEF